MVKDYPPGTVLFAGPDDTETEEEAKEYCRTNGFSKEEVRISRMTIHLENEHTAKIIAVIKR